METLEIVARINFCSVHGPWAWARVSCPKRPDIRKVQGTALVSAGIKEKASYRLTGTVKNDKYGISLDVSDVVPDVASSAPSLVAHMAREFKGCGKASAGKVVDWYRENEDLETLQSILTERPGELADCPLVRGQFRKSVDASKGQGQLLAVRRQFAVMLAGVAGIPRNLIDSLSSYALEHLSVKTLNNSHFNDAAKAAWDEFALDPYSAIKEVPGYSFGNADRIGISIGIEFEHPVRLAALGAFVLAKACEDEGHSFLTEQQFIRRLKKNEAKKPYGVDYRRVVECITEYRFPVLTKQVAETGEIRIYPLNLYAHEMVLAKHCERMLSGNRALMSADVAKVRLADAMSKTGISLSDEQYTELLGILTSPYQLHTLTAGPGCGKTASMEVLAVAVKGVYKVAFAAPTGKAAKVLSERVSSHGFTSSTVHRLLEPTMGDSGMVEFQRNADNPLEQDVIGLDEGSMMDLALTRRLMDALKSNAHLIKLGDPDQLPSVGPGNVLSDILLMTADHHRLTREFRNEGGILDLVKTIRHGHFPKEAPGADVCLMGDPGKPEIGFGHIKTIYDEAGTLVRGKIIPGPVLLAYWEAVKRHGIENVGLIIPRRKGETDIPGWNLTYVNSVLQLVMNRRGPKIGQTGLRQGDRIIIRKNIAVGESETGEAEEFVVNGDTGYIDAWVPDNNGKVSELYIRLDDHRRVRIEGKHLQAVNLGYAITVHASQGSEFAETIVYGQDSAPLFATRGLLYTAVSRARKRLVIFGSWQRLEKTANTPSKVRNSGLAEMTQARLENKELYL